MPCTIEFRRITTAFPNPSRSRRHRHGVRAIDVFEPGRAFLLITNRRVANGTPVLDRNVEFVDRDTLYVADFGDEYRSPLIEHLLANSAPSAPSNAAEAMFAARLNPEAAHMLLDRMIHQEVLTLGELSAHCFAVRKRLEGEE
jgi:hypothetical protein